MEFTVQSIRNDRVRRMTPHQTNIKIDRKTQRNIRGVESMGADAVWRRLEELDREWDIDRAVMALFSSLVFVQLMAARKNRNWLWGPLIQTPFLFMHAMIGWCPPTALLRPLGFRTRKEIEAEREALLEFLRQ